MTNANNERTVIRRITLADDDEIADIIDAVKTEFGAGGPGFATRAEFGALSVTHSRPRHGYFVVEASSEPGDRRLLGGGGFAPLVAGDDDVCEIQRMYLRKETRGFGVGKRLLEEVCRCAHDAGFRRAYLETYHTMHEARRLYVSMGFTTTTALGSTGHRGCNGYFMKDLHTTTERLRVNEAAPAQHGSQKLE